MPVDRRRFAQRLWYFQYGWGIANLASLHSKRRKWRTAVGTGWSAIRLRIVGYWHLQTYNSASLLLAKEPAERWWLLTSIKEKIGNAHTHAHEEKFSARPIRQENKEKVANGENRTVVFYIYFKNKIYDPILFRVAVMYPLINPRSDSLQIYRILFSPFGVRNAVLTYSLRRISTNFYKYLNFYFTSICFARRWSTSLNETIELRRISE